MKVESISGLSVVPVTNLVRAWVSEGSIALPVESTQYLYSNFKHVRGIPAPGNSSGYSLAKLRALDNLIERLQNLKGQDRVPDFTVKPVSEGGSPSLDAQVDSLRKQLNETLNSRMPSFRGFAGLDAGLSLNLTI